MTHNQTPASIVVGIDGTQAAINAALWAVDEAVGRDLPLRLVHVTQAEERPALAAELFERDVNVGKTALSAAAEAVNATGKPVKVETGVLWGVTGTMLIEESRNAAMICVGSTGIARLARLLLGSTVTALAEGAHCPVGIIRTRDVAPTPGTNWIATVVDESPDDDAVIRCALDEARLRDLPVLALGVWQEDLGETQYDELDRRIEVWRQQYPDVHIYPVTTRAGVARFLAENDEPISLVVIGDAGVDEVTEILGPHSHAFFGHAESSVLVVRS